MRASPTFTPPTPMAFAPDDIEIKEFVPTMRGYDRAEVRSFLRAVAEDVRRLEEKLEDQSRRTLEHPAPFAHSVAAESAPSALHDAILELTNAVRLLAHQANAPKINHAVVATPHGSSPSRTLAPHVTPASPRSLATDGTRVTTVASAASPTWPAVERRSARRPWAGRTAQNSPATASPNEIPGTTTGTTTGTSTGTSTSTGSATDSAVFVRGSNRELIRAFLPQVLHRDRVSVDRAPVNIEPPSHGFDEVAESQKTNVVPLMRAV